MTSRSKKGSYVIVIGKVHKGIGMVVESCPSNRSGAKHIRFLRTPDGLTQDYGSFLYHECIADRYLKKMTAAQVRQAKQAKFVITPDVVFALLDKRRKWEK